MKLCAWGIPATYDACCGRLHAGAAAPLEEHSRFARDAGRWAYVGPV